MPVKHVSHNPLLAATIFTKEEFDLFVSEVRSRPDYQEPCAFAIGIATLDESGTVIDIWHPKVNAISHGVLQNKGAAAVFADTVGYKGGNMRYFLNYEQTIAIGARFHPFIKGGIRDTIQQHPNIHATFIASRTLLHQNEQTDIAYKPTLTFLSNLDEGTATECDRWLVERIVNNDLEDKALIDLTPFKRSPSLDLYKKLLS